MHKSNFNYFSPILVSILLLIMVSCGYHLRGDISLPERYKVIYIEDLGNQDMALLLKQKLVENKIELVDSPQSANSVISIYPIIVNRRALAVRGSEVKEYEIQLTSSFAVHESNGDARGETQTISAMRRYSFNNTQVLGADNEEQILIKEIQEDLVLQILRRISKI